MPASLVIEAAAACSYIPGNSGNPAIALHAPKRPTTIQAATRKAVPRTPRTTTLEDRLEAKAPRGDREVFAGPSLDELSREERHKLLYDT